MYVLVNMKYTRLRPIIPVKLLNSVHTIIVDALIDTGSTKAFWVGDTNLLQLLSKRHISDDGVARGFGTGAQNNLPVEEVDICVRGDNGLGINFRNLPVTNAKLNTGGLFSLVLPYTMFNKFDFGFKRSELGNNGSFYLNADNDQINYNIISGFDECVIDCFTQNDEMMLSDNIVINEIKSFE